MVGFAALLEFFRSCFRAEGGELRPVVEDMGDCCGEVDVLIRIGLVVDLVSTGLECPDSCLMEGEVCWWLERPALR